MTGYHILFSAKLQGWCNAILKWSNLWHRRICAGGIWLEDRRPGSKAMICDARNLYVLSIHWNAEAVRGKKGFRDKLWFSACCIDNIEAAAASCSKVQCVKEMSVCKVAECCMQCLPIIFMAYLAQHCGICSLVSEIVHTQELLHVKLLIILIFGILKAIGS